LARIKWHIYLTMSDFAEIVANAGHVEEISAIVDETLERAERNQELWAFPEHFGSKANSC